MNSECLDSRYAAQRLFERIQSLVSLSGFCHTSNLVHREVIGDRETPAQFRSRMRDNHSSQLIIVPHCSSVPPFISHREGTFATQS